MTPTIMAPTGSMLLFSREIVSMEGSWHEEKSDRRARQEEIERICQGAGIPFHRGEIAQKSRRKIHAAMGQTMRREQTSVLPAVVRAMPQRARPRCAIANTRRPTLTLPFVAQRFTVRRPGCSLAW